MLTVGDSLSSLTLGAGEPFLLQVELQNADGSPIDLSKRAFVLTFYKANRAVAAKIDGEPSTDGTFLRFEEDGTFSEGLFGQTPNVELAERLKNGRNVIATGALTVKATAATVAPLDNGSVGEYAIRAVFKATDALGDKLAFTQSVVAYVPPGTAPKPAPQITLTGPLTYAADAAAGALIANIGNVPAGVTPTITPGDGREVIAGDATGGWKVVKGMSASSEGTISTTIAAAGATSLTQNVTVTAAASTPTLTRNTANAAARPGQGIGTFVNVESGATLALTDDANGAVQLNGYELSLGSGAVPQAPATLNLTVRKTLKSGAATSYPIAVQVGRASLVADNFAGAAGTALNGRNTSAGSKTWAGDAGWTLDGNGNVQAPTGGGQIVMDVGASDYFLTTLFTSYSDGSGGVSLANLIFRYIDPSHYWYIRPEVRSNTGGAASVLTLTKVYSGNEYEMAAIGTGNSSGQQLRAGVRVEGGNITIFIDGREVLTFVDDDASYIAATKAGLGCGAGGTAPGRATFADFQIAQPMGTRINWGFFKELSDSTPVVPKGPDGAWDSSDLNNPNVMLDPVKGGLVMDYTGYYNNGTYVQNKGTARATSPKGPWTKDPNNPVFVAADDPNVDGDYGMNGGMVWSPARGLFLLTYGSDRATTIRMATSPTGDKGTWTRQGVVVSAGNSAWKSGGVFDAQLRRTNDNTLELWYAGQTGDYHNRCYGRMTSTDEGVTWVDDPANPLIVPGAVVQNGGIDSFISTDAGEPCAWTPAGSPSSHIMVLADGVKTISAYTGPNYNFVEDRSIQGYVTLDGGKNWRRRVDVLRASGSGFMSAQVFDSCLFDDGTNTYLYHSAGNQPGAALGLNIQIGLAATASLTSLVAS
jgi:hypothetical protein